VPTRCDHRGGQVRSPHTVTAALRRFIGDYRREHSPTPHTDRVLDWLCACQTRDLGGRMVECECGWCDPVPVYNSCGNRHCPQCRGGVRAEWLDKREAQLLPVPHFQVVVTLPGVLRELARDNGAVVYGLLLQVATETLKELAAQKLGAQLGVLAVLHTWASDLSFHPHVHCLVTAGGLRLDQVAWVETRPDYLFPTSVMALMVRGKLLEGLREASAEGTLHVRGDPAHAEVALDATLRKAGRQKWVVHVDAPEGRPAALVAKYLARYVSGIAISDARMVEVTDTHVSYKTRKGLVTVQGHEFVRRFASHILPWGFNKVRYYGLYAPGNAKTRLVRAREILGAPVPPPPRERPPRTCPECGRPVRERSIPGLRRFPPSHPPRARGPP